MTSYEELLRSPRWQEMRLRIMQKARFTCERCGAKDRTLTVHHSYYESGLMPWEYPEESLHCLCEPCHQWAQRMYRAIKRTLGKLSLKQTALSLAYMIRLVNRGSVEEFERAPTNERERIKKLLNEDPPHEEAIRLLKRLQHISP